MSIVPPPITTDSYPQDISGNPIAFGGPFSGGSAGPASSYNGLFIPGYGAASISGSLWFNQNVVTWVCAQDPYCCDNMWDPKCVQLAAYAVDVSGITAGVLGTYGINLSGSEYLVNCSGCSDTVSITTETGTFTLSAGQYIARGISSWNTTVDQFGNYNCYWHYYNDIDISSLIPSQVVKDVILYYDTSLANWVCRVIFYGGEIRSYISTSLNNSYTYNVGLSTLSGSYVSSSSFGTSASLISSSSLLTEFANISGGYNPPCLPCAGTPNRIPAITNVFTTYYKFSSPNSAVYFETNPISGAGRYLIQTSSTFDTSASTAIYYCGTDSTLTNIQQYAIGFNSPTSTTIFTSAGAPFYFKIYDSFTGNASFTSYDDFGAKVIYVDNAGPGNFINALDSNNFTFSNNIAPYLPCFESLTDLTNNAVSRFMNTGIPISGYPAASLGGANFPGADGTTTNVSEITNNSFCAFASDIINIIPGIGSIVPISGALQFVTAAANFTGADGASSNITEITNNSFCSFISDIGNLPYGIGSVIPVSGGSQFIIYASNFTSSDGAALTTSQLSTPICVEISDAALPTSMPAINPTTAPTS